VGSHVGQFGVVVVGHAAEICGRVMPLHQSLYVRGLLIVRLASRRQGRPLRGSTVTALAPPAAWRLALHAGVTRRRVGPVIVHKTCQPQIQEFFATIANHINLRILPAKPEILGIRDFHFMRANVTDAIQTEL